MNFRPHTHKVKITAGSDFDNEGNLIVDGDDGDWSDASECRFETGGKNNVKAVAGGSFTVYKYVVYCSPTESLIGKTVRLFNTEGNEVYTGQVMDHFSGQLHSILYL